MRVLSASIVADAESAPVKVPEPAADADAIVAEPPAAPAAAVARAAEPARDDDDDLIVAPGSPTRFVWMLGAIALGLAMILGVAMPRAAKRVDKPAAAAVATTEPRPENAPRAETSSTPPAKDDPAIEMKDEPETAPKADTSHAGSTAAAKDDSSKSDDSRSDPKADSKSDAKDDAKADANDDSKSDAKDEPAPKSGAKLDSKRAAEAELAYRDGEQRAAIGDTDGALKSLRRAADLNPGYAPTYRALGDVYAKRGETGKARSSYQRYLKLAPNAGDASKVRGRLDAL